MDMAVAPSDEPHEVECPVKNGREHVTLGESPPRIPQLRTYSVVLGIKHLTLTEFRPVSRSCVPIALCSVLRIVKVRGFVFVRVPSVVNCIPF